MSALVAAALAATGVMLIWSTLGARPPAAHASSQERVVTDLTAAARRWALRQGLEGVALARFTASTALAAAIGIACALVLLGSWPLALGTGLAMAMIPFAARRRRTRALRRVAAASWPRLLEDLRVRTGAIGRPIPQALLEVGARGPEELRGAFAAAAREWALTTDFDRLVAVLKERLDDPTADAVCETLLVAHEVGGDIDSRLAALAEDRRTDQRHRLEAEARQAGARVARWFVVIVPAGMALAGYRLGDGGAAFRSAGAQLAAALAVALIVLCWIWAGRIMRLPDDTRVFDR